MSPEIGLTTTNLIVGGYTLEVKVLYLEADREIL
jgi:hypothetical protein